MDEKKGDEKNKFKFKYIFPDDFNPKYVNGAYGGIGTKGEIIVNFYFERLPLPKSQTHLLSEENKLGKEIEREPDDIKMSCVRFVDTGIILNLQNAKVIHDWLGGKIKQLEGMIEEEKKMSEKEKRK